MSRVSDMPMSEQILKVKHRAIEIENEIAVSFGLPINDPPHEPSNQSIQLAAREMGAQILKEMYEDLGYE